MNKKESVAYIALNRDFLLAKLLKSEFEEEKSLRDT
jgi:hypothetical protein